MCAYRGIGRGAIRCGPGSVLDEPVARQYPLWLQRQDALRSNTTAVPNVRAALSNAPLSSLTPAGTTDLAQHKPAGSHAYAGACKYGPWLEASRGLSCGRPNPPGGTRTK